ncbi:MAG TPA: D-glucuronyl C5-epimerase family protein [Kofleriaceae bacterium]|nr:D-glucuronyl C5-epimerase family protein [Kofleriaceae bacterium]
MSLVSNAARARLSSALFQVARWRHEHRLMARDPIALEPYIEPHNRELGFSHGYIAGYTGETARWLGSVRYAGEAAKQDPVDLCHWAIDRFHAFLETGDAAAREDFLAESRRLHARGHLSERAGRRCFVVPQCAPGEGHAAPWLGASAQGCVGAVLIRAFQLTGDRLFEEAARAAIQPFLIDVAAGGVRGVERHGHVFYDEVALPGRARHVLNGFLSALLGIWDVARATGDADARRAFDDGVAGLDDRVLASFDTGHVTLHEQGPPARVTPSCAFATWLHVRRLAALARITRQPRLFAWAERWRAYVQGAEHRAVTAIECLRPRSWPRHTLEAASWPRAAS